MELTDRIIARYGVWIQWMKQVRVTNYGPKDKNNAWYRPFTKLADLVRDIVYKVQLIDLMHDIEYGVNV